MVLGMGSSEDVSVSLWLADLDCIENRMVRVRRRSSDSNPGLTDSSPAAQVPCISCGLDAARGWELFLLDLKVHCWTHSVLPQSSASLLWDWGRLGSAEAVMGRWGGARWDTTLRESEAKGWGECGEEHGRLWLNTFGNKRKDVYSLGWS